MTRWGLVLSVLLLAWPAAAKEPAGPAHLVVDAGSGRVLAAENAGQQRHPASLTKLMTVYLAFAAVDEGRAKADTRIAVSPRAAGQQGSVLGLKAGGSLTLAEAVKALIVRSANDAAVAIAEHLAGGEAEFAQRMTATARQLGMTASSFQNATGLTAPGHLSTPRDMAILALALRKRFPDLYPLFAQRQMDWGRGTLPTVNGFLTSFSGAEGMKTGFTCPAGYNLVATAQRGGRRLVAVVMGAPGRKERDAAMARLMEAAFKKGEPGEPAPSLADLPNGGAVVPDLSGSVCKGGVPGASSSYGGKRKALPKGWALEVAFGHSERETRQRLGQAQKRLGRDAGGGSQAVVLHAMGGLIVYRGLIAGLKEEKAVQTCLAARGRGEWCLVLNPAMLEGALDTERRLMMAVAR
ncbi:MAG: D-alanyl-D-alanine carboxypeptidase [Magnetospirillum sp. WYHS-4]